MRTEAVGFADTSMEAVCYYAYWASTELAQERGEYELSGLAVGPRHPAAGHDQAVARRAQRIRRPRRIGNARMGGARARIPIWDAEFELCCDRADRDDSNIIGVSACIEPSYQNIFVKSNLSGEFTVVNEYLVNDLKQRSLWDEVMISDLKYFDGSLTKIDRVPAELRALYATAFEIDTPWMVEAGPRGRSGSIRRSR